MGAVVNGNVWAGACVNGKVVSGLVKNGVVFYKKDTTPSVLYKRRIMVGDNLNSKVLYITLPPDFVVDSSTSIVETDMLNEIIKTKQSGDTGTPNVDLVYISDFIFVGLIGKTQYNMQSDFGTVTDIVDTDDAYRHLFIEDPNIRPIQVGDKVVSGTKFYGVVPDDYNANNINSIIRDANNNAVGYFSFYENTAELWIRASSAIATDYMFQKNPMTSINNSRIISQTEYTVGSITNETNPNFAYLLVDTTTLGA